LGLARPLEANASGYPSKEPMLHKLVLVVVQAVQLALVGHLVLVLPWVGILWKGYQKKKYIYIYIYIYLYVRAETKTMYIYIYIQYIYIYINV